MTENSAPSFGIKDKLGYMFGDFGNDFTFIFELYVKILYGCDGN